MKRLFIFLFISFYSSVIAKAQNTANAQVCFSHCPDSQGKAILILETGRCNSYTFFSDSLAFKFAVPKADYFMKLIQKGHKPFHSTLRLSDINAAEDETTFQWFDLTHDSEKNESLVLTDSNYCDWRVSYKLSYNVSLFGAIPSIEVKASNYSFEWMGYNSKQATVVNVFDKEYLDRLEDEIALFFHANRRFFKKAVTQIISRDTNNIYCFRFDFSTVDSAFSGYELIRRFIEQKKGIRATHCSTAGYHLSGVGSCYESKKSIANLYYGFTTQEKMSNRRPSKIPKAERYFIRMDIIRRK